MLLAGFVVAEELALEDVFEEFLSDLFRRPTLRNRGWGTRARASGVWFGAAGGEFERVVGGAGVAIGKGSDAEEDVVADFDGFSAEATLFVGEGAAKQVHDLRRGERIENVDLGAREKGRDDFERGIFGGRADEGDVARFDVGKKGVLLGLVEAVDFVHENDGALSGTRFVFGGGHDFLDFFDAGEDSTESDKLGAREARNEARESGLAAAGRAPEKHGADVVALDLETQGLAVAEKFFLADEFVEGAGAHAFGERLMRGGHVGLGRNGEFGKEAHGLCLVAAGIGQAISLTGGFVEENSGCCGGVEGLDAGGHGDVDAHVGGALDFFGKAGTLVADEQGYGFAPVHFPWSEQRRISLASFATTGGERVDMSDFELGEKNGERHSGKNGEMKSRTGGSAKGFGRKRACGTGLAGSRGDGAGGAKGGSGAKDGADVSRVLNSRENDEKRSAGVGGSGEQVVKGSRAGLNEGGDALGMFGVGEAFEEAVGGVQNWESHFRATDEGSETVLVALAGFAEQNGADAAAGTERFFHQANAFDTHKAGFGGQAASQG